MVNLQVVHTFLKDPLTDKLVRRYVQSPKTLRAIETSVHVVEILMVAMPLIDSAVRGVREMFKSNQQTRQRPSGAGTGTRRNLSAHTAPSSN